MILHTERYHLLRAPFKSAAAGIVLSTTADRTCRNPVLSAAALMPSAGIGSLIKSRVFLALSTLAFGGARAVRLARWEPTMGSTIKLPRRAFLPESSAQP